MRGAALVKRFAYLSLFVCEGFAPSHIFSDERGVPFGR